MSTTSSPSLPDEEKRVIFLPVELHTGRLLLFPLLISRQTFDAFYASVQQSKIAPVLDIRTDRVASSNLIDMILSFTLGGNVSEESARKMLGIPLEILRVMLDEMKEV